ncbi:MAG TPA: sugar phosphate isomerase/epimerase family protein [Gemmataceae bacterium]|nr:sugar phosphate isomerase/epimerase family protein [Gemmataceae bacterium]
MLLGYNTNGFAHHRLEDTVEILAELGYRALGLTADFHTIDPLADRWPERARKLDRRLRKAGLRVVIETGARFIVNPRRKHQPTVLDPDRHKALDRLDFLQACIRLAAELDADCVSFWSGAAVEETQPKILMARLVEACLRLCDFAEGRRIRLAFEPEPGMFIDTMDKFAELHGKVNRPNFGLTLDIGHMHCMGELPIGDHIRRWKQWLWNVHIEDMKRGVHEHLMFGEGEVDFADVMRALREIGYKRGVYVELSRHSHDAVETARKAIAFLKAIPRESASQPGWWDGLEPGAGESRPGELEPDQIEVEDEYERQTDVGGRGGPLAPAGDEHGQPAGQERADDQARDPR